MRRVEGVVPGKVFMKKFWLSMSLLVVALSVVAGECRYCGADTDEITVYRCTNCRTFFCDRCRGGKKSTGVAELDLLVLMSNSGRTRIVCPECGAEDVKGAYGSGMKNGVIKIVR